MVNDFDSLFRSVWLGECPPEVLADYILEQLTERPAVDRHTEVRHPPEAEYPSTVRFAFYRPAGLPEVVGVWIVNLSTATQYSLHFDRTEFAAEFPEWLAERMVRLKLINVGV